MGIILMIHSLLRWVIVVVAVIAVVKLFLSWRQGGAFDGMDRGLSAGFSGLMDLQALLGILFLLGDGLIQGAGFPAYRIVHAAIMVAAVAVGHLPARKRTAPAPERYQISLQAILGSLALVVLGVSILPQGWLG